MLGNVSPTLNIKSEPLSSTSIDVFPEFPPELLYENQPLVKANTTQKPNELTRSLNIKHRTNTASINHPIIFSPPKFNLLHDTHQIELPIQPTKQQILVSILPWDNPRKIPTKTITQHPTNSSPNINKVTEVIFKARKYLLMNNIDLAFECLSDIIDKGIEHTDVYYLFGEVSRRKGIMYQAERFLLKSMKFQKYSMQVYFSLGLLYIESYEFSKALYYLKQFVSKEVSAEGNFWLGKVFAELKQYTQSIEAFSQAITLNSKGASYYLHRGQVYEIKGMMLEAKIDYEKALSIDSKCLVPYYMKYKELQSRGDIEKAKKIKRFLLNIKKLHS